jgi:hypothetical protein
MKGYARRRADRRGYDCPAGALPSVTTILGATSAGKENLRQWLARPGAESMSLDARTRGTWTHTCIEHWIQGVQPRGFGVAVADALYGSYFRNIEPWLEAHFVEAVAIEAAVWHPAGFSGTFDCLGYAAYGDTPAALTLLDWKTAARERSGDLLEDYRCQLGAYTSAIEHCWGVRPTRALLVIARPHTHGPDVYELGCAELTHYEAEFFHRLGRFYEAPRDAD